MIKVYTGLKGFTALLFFTAGILLCLSVFFWGAAKIIGFLLPLLTVLAYLLIFVFVLGFLPAAFFKDLRPSLCLYSLFMSHALGLAAWLASFFVVVKAFGVAGMFLAFLFQFLTPIAIAAALLKGTWHLAGHLFLWMSFAYGMKFYSQWLLNLNAARQKSDGVIDVEAVEVRDKIGKDG